MGFRYEHPTKLIGEVNSGEKYRAWYLVYRELKFGDFNIRYKQNKAG